MKQLLAKSRAASVVAFFLTATLIPCSDGAEPVYVGGGSTAVTSGSSVNLNFVGNPRAGDVFVIFLMIQNINLSNVAGSPSGFTQLFGPDQSTAGGNSRLFLFCKDSNGTETGAVTVTFTTGTGYKIGFMTMFRNAAPCGAGFYEDAKLSGGSGDNSIEAPPVTTLGKNRLAASWIWVEGDVLTATPFAGETGGDWLNAGVGTQGFVGDLQIQTASIPVDATISSGSKNMNGSALWGIRSFAVKPANTSATPFLVRSGTAIADSTGQVLAFRTRPIHRQAIC